jgi:phytol kinase
MSPLVYNSIVTVISVIYVFSIVAIMDWFVKKGFPRDISRKIVHIAAGSWIFFWVFFDNTHWSKYLNIAPAFIWTILLIQKGFFAKPDDNAVKTMTRTGDKRELLKGPLYFTIIMNLMGTVFYNTSLSVTAMAYLGWGDGIAPVAGKRFGKHKYKILSEKSIEGSVAFFIFGFLAAIFFNYFIFGYIRYPQILFAGLLAVVSEAISPPDLDNLIIPLAVSFFYIFAYSNLL